MAHIDVDTISAKNSFEFISELLPGGLILDDYGVGLPTVSQSLGRIKK